MTAAPALRAAVLFALTIAPAMAPGRPPAYPEKFAVLHVIALAFATLLVFLSHLLGPGIKDKTEDDHSDLLPPPPQWRLDVAKVLKWSAILFVASFAFVRIAYGSAPYSPMWRPDCLDWDRAERQRLSAATSTVAARQSQAPWTILRHGTRSPAKGGTGQLCVAYSTIPRTHRYLTQAVWTLFEGFRKGDREMLAGPVLLVTSSTNHTEANEIQERFGPHVQVRHVPPPPAADSGYARESEDAETRQWRESWDYAHTLEECQKTGAAFALILEDDVISSGHLVQKAVDNAQRLNKKRANRWLSLRLWATDKFAGWESTPREICELIGGAVVGGLLISVAFSAATRIHSLKVGLTVWATWAVGLVILQEAMGRQYCLPSFKPGLSLDYRHGANAEHGRLEGYAGVVTGVAQVFPLNDNVNTLMSYLKQHAGQDQTDMLVRTYAAEEGKDLEQWMIWPPLVQHIGRQSSVGHTSDDWTRCRGLPVASAFVGEEGTVLG